MGCHTGATESGPKRWNRRVARTIDTFRTLFDFDALYMGGGNARKATRI